MEVLSVLVPLVSAKATLKEVLTVAGGAVVLADSEEQPVINTARDSALMSFPRCLFTAKL